MRQRAVSMAKRLLGSQVVIAMRTWAEALDGHRRLLRALASLKDDTRAKCLRTWRDAAAASIYALAVGRDACARMLLMQLHHAWAPWREAAVEARRLKITNNRRVAACMHRLGVRSLRTAFAWWLHPRSRTAR